MSADTSNFVRARVRGPLHLDESKRQQAIELTTSWAKRWCHVSHEKPPGYIEWKGLTAEEFVEWLYDYWQRAEKGVSKRGRVCIEPPDSILYRLHMAESMGVIKLLGMRLVE